MVEMVKQILMLLSKSFLQSPLTRRTYTYTAAVDDACRELFGTESDLHLLMASKYHKRSKSAHTNVLNAHLVHVNTPHEALAIHNVLKRYNSTKFIRAWAGLRKVRLFG